MNRNNARDKVIDLLLDNNNPNADFYASMFENFQYQEAEMTPISPLEMGHVNSENNIVITEETYLELQKIREITEKTNKEVAYFIFGEEKPNGTVWLDTVISGYKPSSATSASFNDINKVLNDYVKGIENGEYNGTNKQIICHGHTHTISPVSDNFSFGDLISYVEFANLHPLSQKRQVETIGMLMPPCGDFNFILYENNPRYEGFYTFPNVYMRYNNGDAIQLPAYTKGNYIRKISNYRSR